jgi:hypothetical protein
MREFNRLHHICPNEITLQSQLVSQAHGPGAVRSGRGDENLDVHWLGQRRYLGLGRL